MDRRSFLTALIGGMTFASIGGVAFSEAAEPDSAPKPAEGELPRETAEALDGQDAEFTRRRRRHWRRYYRRHYRPRFYRRRYYYRPYRRYYGPRYYYRPRRRFHYRYW